MTQLFREFADIARTEDNAHLIAALPRELGMEHDGEIVSVKELLLSEAIESTTLIQDEAYKTVIEGSEPSKCIRSAIPTIAMKSNIMNVTTGETGTYAGVVAEGAEIPIETQDFNTVEFKSLKYGVRPLITVELIEDSMFSIAEIELKKSGARVENSLNQIGISEMMDSAGLEHDCEGSNLGIKAVAAGVSAVRAAGYNPDTIIMHPEAEALILAEFVPTNYYPTESIVKTGQVPNILGLKAYTCGVTDIGSETWSYGANGEIGMIIFDSTAFAAIGMRRDITVNQYNDNIRDLVGISVTARFDVEVMVPAAGCRVEY